MLVRNHNGVDKRFIIALLLMITFAIGLLCGMYMENSMTYQDEIILKCETLEDNRG